MRVQEVKAVGKRNEGQVSASQEKGGASDLFLRQADGSRGCRSMPTGDDARPPGRLGTTDRAACIEHSLCAVLASMNSRAAGQQGSRAAGQQGSRAAGQQTAAHTRYTCLRA